MNLFADIRALVIDALAAMAAALHLAGARVEEHEDGLTIHGTGGEPLRGTANGRVKSLLDHRIAMSMGIAGLVSTGGVEVDDISPINTSFPTFMGLLAEAAA